MQTEINLIELFGKQSELDNMIAKKKDLDLTDTQIYYKRVLALQVELGELANEVRFFKFWSENQKASDRVLEEYVDCLHFFLSLGIFLDMSEYVSAPMFPNDESLITDKESMNLMKMFALLYKFTSDLYEKGTYYPFALYAFIDLGYMLGFEWKQIKTAYQEKYAENIKRQASGY